MKPNGWFSFGIACFVWMLSLSSVWGNTDVDGDGKTGVSEVVYSLQEIAGIVDTRLADIDSNGRTEVKEAVTLLKTVCGMCKSMPYYELTTDMGVSVTLAGYTWVSDDISLTQPAHGTASFLVKGDEYVKVKYIPNPEFFGLDNFVYTVDGCMAPIHVAVKGPNAVIPFVDGTHGVEPWVTNGTPDGTRMITDLNPGFLNSFVMLDSEVHRLGDDYLFSGSVGDPQIHELCKATIDSAERIAVIDSSTGAGAYSLPSKFVTYGAEAYFIARNYSQGNLIYKTNGTTGGTVLVKDIVTEGEIWENQNHSIYDLATMGGSLYFNASDMVNGYALWKSDGTTSGTVLLKTLDQSGVVSKELSEIGDRLYFCAASGQGSPQGYELWTSDGTETGTALLKDINPSGDSNPSNFVQAGDAVFYGATRANGRELWKTDGTEGGTSLVKNVPYFMDNRMAACGNKVFFVATD